VRVQGGQLATVLEHNAARGEAFVRDYAARLLRRVTVPLTTMIHHWIYRGELHDPHGDFFIAAKRASAVDAPLAALSAANAWSGSYEVREELLPDFVPRALAARVLRAGKTINFLREVCGDTAWVQESAAAEAAQVAVPDAEQARARLF
jgi:gamma-tubulin complex component 3